jgi:hypothetical protein
MADRELTGRPSNSSRHQISSFKATEGLHPPYRAALSHQCSVVSFATLLVLSCLYSPVLRCSCCNGVRFCCGLEAHNSVMATIAVDVCKSVCKNTLKQSDIARTSYMWDVEILAAEVVGCVFRNVGKAHKPVTPTATWYRNLTVSDSEICIVTEKYFNVKMKTSPHSVLMLRGVCIYMNVMELLVIASKFAPDFLPRGKCTLTLHDLSHLVLSPFIHSYFQIFDARNFASVTVSVK